MKIILDQAELETAIIEHMTKQLIVGEGKQFSVELNVTRNPAGYSATVEIINTKTVADIVEESKDVPTTIVEEETPKRKKVFI